MPYLPQIRDQLSERQQQALELGEGSALVAGAGAGKTRTLVSLVIRDLIVDNIDPSQILVCTFTRAAAAGLITRINHGLREIAPDYQLDLSRMWVGTIDSICARYLRENAIAAGLGPNFKIAEGGELARLYQKALNESLLQTEPDKIAQLDQIIDTANALASLIPVYNQLRLTNFREPSSPPIADNIQLIQSLQALLDQELSASLQKKLAKDLEGVTAHDWRQISNGAYGKPKATQAQAIAEAKELLIDYKRNLIDQESYPLRLNLFEFLQRFHMHLTALKQATGSLDFIDLSLYTNDLLESNPVGFHRVYVDEAQDTSPLQLDILRAMGPMIIVGDACQSIYGFRGADVEGFRQQRMLAHQEVALNENYRSQESIVEFINKACSKVDGLATEAIKMQSKVEQTDDKNKVHVYLNIDEAKKLSALEEAQLMLPDIINHALELGYNLSDICILCSTNDDCLDYAQVLENHNIPVALIQKRGLFARSECLDVIAYLDLLIDTTDDEALLRVLSSPFVGLDDNELYRLSQSAGGHGAREKESLWSRVLAEPSLTKFVQIFNHVRDRAHDFEVHGLLLYACEEHDYDLALEAIDPTGLLWRNVEKLALVLRDLALLYDGSRLSRVLELLREEIDLGIDSGQDGRIDSDAVKVMTIHIAKGDEFPFVVLARCNRSVPAERDAIIVDLSGQIGLSFGTDAQDSVLQKERERRKQAKLEEQKRLWYVAMTRAQEQLTMVISAKTNKDGTWSLAGAAKYLLEDVISPLIPDEDEMQVVSDYVKTWNTSGAQICSYTQAHNPVVIKSQEDGLEKSVADIYTRYFEPLKPVVPVHSYTSLEGQKTLQERLTEMEPTTIIGQGALGFGRRVHKQLESWQPNISMHLIGQDPDEEKRLRSIEKSLSQISPQLQGWELIDTELEFNVLVNQELFHGYMDAVYKKDDQYLIIDWKTGDVEEFQQGYVLQRQLYALALLRSNLMISQVETRWIYLERLTEDGIYTESQVFDQDDLSKLIASIGSKAGI